MAFELPATCGYTPGLGTAIDYHEAIQSDYVMHLGNMYDPNPSPEYLLKGKKKAYNDLIKHGITEAQVIGAAKSAFNLDINTLYSLNIPKDVLLPWSHVNAIHSKQIDALSEFTASGNPGSSSSFDAQAASSTLTTALENGKDVNKHYFSTKKRFRPASLEAKVAERHHKKFIYSANEAIVAVEQRGGTISDALKADFFDNSPAKVIDLADAEDLARNKFKLDNPKTGIRSIFRRNYKNG